jgi:hypothetical protein
MFDSQSARRVRTLVDLKRGAVRDTCTRILDSQAKRMPSCVPLPQPGFDQLSVDEQIDYVQSLWDRIVAIPGLVPVQEWRLEILDQGLKERDAMDAGESWDVVRERLPSKPGSDADN